MLDKSIRRRLRALQRRRGIAPGLRDPLPAVSREEAEAASPAPTVGPVPPTPQLPSGPLEKLVPGRVIASENGSLYVIEAQPVDLVPEVGSALSDLAGLFAAPKPGNRPLYLPAGKRFSDLVLMDIETAGLCAAPIFLAGFLLWTEALPETARLVQLMARDYSEERALLAETARLLDSRQVLVTYNGRSFDLRMLHERVSYHRLPALPEPEWHLDLLGPLRRCFGGRWEDCRLQTLERRLLKRQRGVDITGREIPQAYHDFVHTGDAGRIKLVVEHNRLDLITMLQLLPHVDPT